MFPVDIQLNECSTKEEMKGVCKGQHIFTRERDGLSFAAIFQGAVHGYNRGNGYDMSVELKKMSLGGPTKTVSVELDDSGRLLHPVHIEGPMYRALANTFYRIEVDLAN